MRSFSYHIVLLQSFSQWSKEQFAFWEFIRKNCLSKIWLNPADLAGNSIFDETNILDLAWHKKKTCTITNCAAKAGSTVVYGDSLRKIQDQIGKLAALAPWFYPLPTTCPSMRVEDVISANKKMKSVKIIFLPHNTCLKIHPMKQETICYLKAY